MNLKSTTYINISVKCLVYSLVEKKKLSKEFLFYK